MKQSKKKIEVEGDVPFYTDAYRLTVVLHNLISNAIKYRDVHKTDQFIRVSVWINPASARIQLFFLICCEPS